MAQNIIGILSRRIFILYALLSLKPSPIEYNIVTVEQNVLTNI